MKQYLYRSILLVFICFIILQFGDRSTGAMKTNGPDGRDLIALANVLQEEKIAVDEWSIHAREKLVDVEQQEDVEIFVQEVKKKFPEWDWKEIVSEQNWQVTAVSSEESPIRESIRIVSTPTKKSAQAYVIYEAKGLAWTKDTEDFLGSDLTSTYSDVFRGKPLIFSCIKAELDGKMKTTLASTKNGLLTAFNANEIESLDETSFISATAFSPMFAESLKRNQDSMNLQLALRTTGMGAKTTLVVGTPIITIEY